jgi:GT2 family glycosyltransferase
MNTCVYSFVILSFNSEQYIEKCLSSINQAIKEIKQNAEIFVIDNGSNDGSMELINNYQFCEFINYKVIQFSYNTGTTYSRNEALRKATGNYIVILDSDAYINGEVLHVLSNYLSENDLCGLVVPKLIYPDGRYQLSVDRFPSLIRKIQRYLFLKKIESKAQECEITDVDYAISAFWMLPKSTIDKVGYLDENIFYSPEDVDYCIRIWKAGLSITYNPSATVIHDAQEISRAKGLKLFNLFSFSHLKGLFYLYRKHHFIISGKDIRS